jgi:hypothetical protein
MSRGQQKPILFFFLRPLAFFLNFLFAPIGWLLSPLWRRLEESAARQNQAQLEQDIRAAIPFLFREKGAAAVPNQGVSAPHIFDAAYVTVAAGPLLIRFFRIRGDLDIELASAESPNKYSHFESLLADFVDFRQLGLPIVTLDQVGQLLQTYWPNLLAALGPATTPTNTPPKPTNLNPQTPSAATSPHTPTE